MTLSMGSLERRPWWRSRRAHSAPGTGRSIVVYCRDLRIEDPRTGARLLAEVTLGFRSASLTAILDPTGARSRALFTAILGLRLPEAGSLRVSPAAPGRRDRLASISLIAPSSPIDPELTVRENLLLPLALTGVTTDESSFASALSIAGLVPYADTPGRELGALDRFRLHLARAIVAGGDIILVTDTQRLPSPQDRATALQLLRSLADHGACVLLATAEPEAAAECDRAILLANGRVSADLVAPNLESVTAALDRGPEDPSTLVGPIPAALPSAPIAKTAPGEAGAPSPKEGAAPDAEEDPAPLPWVKVDAAPKAASPGSASFPAERIFAADPPAPRAQGTDTAEQRPVFRRVALTPAEQVAEDAGAEEAPSPARIPLRRREEDPDPITRAIRTLGRDAEAHEDGAGHGRGEPETNGRAAQRPAPLPETRPAPPPPTREQAEVIDLARRILEELPGPIVPEESRRPAPGPAEPTAGASGS